MKDRRIAHTETPYNIEMARPHFSVRKPILKARDKFKGGILADNNLIFSSARNYNINDINDMGDYMELRGKTQEEYYDYANLCEVYEQNNSYESGYARYVQKGPLVFRAEDYNESVSKYDHMISSRMSPHNLVPDCYAHNDQFYDPIDGSPTISKELRSEYTFVCEPCSKKFKRLSTLKIHIFSHIKEAKIFRCPKTSCNSGFKSLSIATKHILHFHRDERNNLIEHLKKAKFTNVFRSFTALLDYYKPMATNPFKGSFCFGCFTYPRSMPNHPCTGMFYSLTQCPACRMEVKAKGLEAHAYSDECKRAGVSVKDFE